ncbi:MAG: hypothetical protein R3F49_10545 [Planctomycetota bacterium]
MRVRGLARRLGAFLGSLAVTLVAAELMVGRYLPVNGVIYAVDDELLHDALPRARRIQAMPPGAVRAGDAARVWIETNSRGFRGPELESRSGRPRLLVLGDSYVMAENVPYEATFVRRLDLEFAARRVNEEAHGGGGDDPELRRAGSARGIECVNAGRSGYGPDQALLLARRCIDDVAPDAVLLVLCAANDLGDLARNKLFRRAPDGRLIQQRARLAPHILRDFAERRDRALQPALRRLWAFGRERRAHTAWPPPADPSLLSLYDELLTAQHREHFIDGDLTVGWLFEDIYDSVQALAPQGRVARDEVALLTAILRALDGLTRARGVPFGVVITPAAPDLVPGLLVTITPESHPGYQRGTLPALHREAAVAAGVRVIDVSQVMAAYADPSALFVGGDDPHWNATGQALAARAVAAELVTWPELRQDD